MGKLGFERARRIMATQSKYVIETEALLQTFGLDDVLALRCHDPPCSLEAQLTHGSASEPRAQDRDLPPPQGGFALACSPDRSEIAPREHGEHRGGSQPEIGERPEPELAGAGLGTAEGAERQHRLRYSGGLGCQRVEGA